MSILELSNIIAELNKECLRNNLLMSALKWIARQPKKRFTVFTDDNGQLSSREYTQVLTLYKVTLLDQLCDIGVVKRASRGNVSVYTLPKEVEGWTCAILIANELERTN